jgi:hypothetical protein
MYRKYENKSIYVLVIICILIHSICYVLNFMLPAYRPNFAEVAHARKRLSRPAISGSSRCPSPLSYSFLCSATALVISALVTYWKRDSYMPLWSCLRFLIGHKFCIFRGTFPLIHLEGPVPLLHFFAYLSTLFVLYIMYIL